MDLRKLKQDLLEKADNNLPNVKRNIIWSKYYHRNKARIIARHRELRLESPEQYKEYANNYYERSKDRRREEIRKNAKRTYDNNREARLKYAREYRLANKEEICAKRRAAYLKKTLTDRS